MKVKLWCGLLLAILIQTSSFATTTDSLNVQSTNSININSSFALGLEYGASFRMEYESNHRGKIIVNGFAGLLFRNSTYVMFDLGLGYGYPIKKINNNSFYLNAFATYSYLAVPVATSADIHGPTGLLEFEYRRTWNNFSLQLIPFYRYIHVYSKDTYEEPLTSFSLRVGCLYRFDLNK